MSPQFDNKRLQGACMNFRDRVTLSVAERSSLEMLVKGGKGAVRRLKRAQVLLAADAGSTDEAIALHVVVSTSTVYRTKQRFVEEGLEAALSELPREGAPRKLDVGDEALLCAVACSAAPEGWGHWTLKLLADELVRLTVHTKISDETVRRRLSEMQLKPWQKKMWCIPKIDAEFVARMEDVLALYAEPPDTRRGRWCASDETPRQLASASHAFRRWPNRGKRARYATTSTCATAPPTFSCSSTSIGHGDTPRVTDHRAYLHRLRGVHARPWSTCTILMPTRSALSSTTSLRTALPLSTSASSRPTLGESSIASSSTSRPNTRAGSTWWRSRSA